MFLHHLKNYKEGPAKNFRPVMGNLQLMGLIRLTWPPHFTRKAILAKPPYLITDIIYIVRCGAGKNAAPMGFAFAITIMAKCL